MTSNGDKTKRWQFGLRSLFLVILVICSVSGWESYRYRHQEAIRMARAEIAILGGTSGKHCSLSREYRVWFAGSELADQQLDRLTVHLKRLPLAFVDVSDCRVTESGAARLSSNLNCSVIRQSETGKFPPATFRNAILASQEEW